MKIISKETSKRVCDHMNNDHIDSVHKYLIHYGKISRFENAYMEEINNLKCEMHEIKSMLKTLLERD